MASKRQYLYEVARDLRRYLEWQGAEGHTGVIPASEEEREREREKWKARRRAKTERMKKALRGGDGKSESGNRKSGKTAQKKAKAGAEEAGAEETPEGKPMAKTGEEAPWKKFKSKKKKRKAGKPGSGKAGQQQQGGRAGQQQQKSRKSESVNRKSGKTTTNGGGTGQQADQMSKEEKLEYLRDYMGDCQRCPLHENRTNLVFGEGDADARLVFVGEAPGYNEDQQGRLFVGKAGQLLNQMINAMGLAREDTYICNVLKSRPPDNRDPRPDEIRECFPFLKKQLQIIEPEVIVTLGRPATQNLLDSDKPLGAMRGRWHEWYGIEVMPTYHPAYLLRSPDQKGKTWNDLQQVIQRLGLSGGM